MSGDGFNVFFTKLLNSVNRNICFSENYSPSLVRSEPEPPERGHFSKIGLSPCGIATLDSSPLSGAKLAERDFVGEGTAQQASTWESGDKSHAVQGLRLPSTCGAQD